MIVDYIDTHAEEYGVEPICRELTAAGVKIAPSTYYATKTRPVSARATRDAAMSPIWSGPVGISAAAGFYAALIAAAGMEAGPLRWWVGAMLFAVVHLVAASMVPAAGRWTDARGIPVASDIAHCLVGVGWGATLWIDLDATRTADVRWITLATLFAVSAGVVGGISGVNFLSAAIFLPMWLGTISALAAAGQFAAAAACAVFATICFKDLLRSGHLWTELMTLRVESHDTAEANIWAATHDQMTGLLNRSGFMQAVSDRADESTSASPIRVMFIDLDRFKEVNDTLGHSAGDSVLIEVAKRIRNSLRSTDLVGRFGGDEFSVLLAADTGESSSDRLARSIIEALEKPFEGSWGSEKACISACVGVASVAPDEAAPERLLLDADLAMYEAKRLGRRRVVHFGSHLEAELSDRLGLKADLRHLLDSRALEADGQPMFDLRTGKVGCVELLARWRSPDGVGVPPDVFIPLAEEMGLISEVTDLMLGKAGQLLQEWQGHPELGEAKVSVNVAASDLTGETLIPAVAEVIERYGIAPGRLVLELTESSDFARGRGDLDQLRALSELGVALAIDDFGTGYSSLEGLLALPLQAVKLDASLIARLDDDPRQAAMLRSITDLAIVIGRRVIVEGVETRSQLDELKRLETAFAQGYYLCRPVPTATLVDHLARLRTDADSPLAQAFPASPMVRD